MKSDIENLMETRKGLRARLKAAIASGNDPEADEIRLQIAGVNKGLKDLRHSLKVADRIEERAEHLEEMKEQLTGFSGPEGSGRTEPEEKGQRYLVKDRKR